MIFTKKKLISLLSLLMIPVLLTACSNDILRTRRVTMSITQTKVILKSAASADASYKDFFNAFKASYIVPGLYEGIIPQGMTLDTDDHLLIISGYYDNGAFPTCLMLLDADSGKLIKHVALAKTNGNDYLGHANGICYSSGHLYVTGGSKAYVLSMKKIVDAKNDATIRFESSFQLHTSGSFACIANGVFWTGEMIKSSDEAHKKAKHIVTLKSGETFYARCEGYKLKDGLPLSTRINPKQTGYYPDYLLALPDLVQGMTVNGKGEFIFSTSSSRTANSKLLRFDNLLKTEYVKTEEIDGKKTPVYAASESLLKKTVTTLPLSKAIISNGDSLILIFESGASKFRSHKAKYPTDTLYTGTF